MAACWLCRTKLEYEYSRRRGEGAPGGGGEMGVNSGLPPRQSKQPSFPRPTRCALARVVAVVLRVETVVLASLV